MKKLLTILLLLITTAGFAQTLIVRNDTIFNYNPSTNTYIQLTKLVPALSGNAAKVLTNDGTLYVWSDTMRSNIYAAIQGKQVTITTGTTLQYFRGDLSLATFPTTTAAFTSSTNKNFVTDAQLTIIGNTSGSNTGDQTITLTGDITGSGTGSFATTLATVASAGTTGSSTAIPVITINAKGLTTSITTTVVIAPAGTLTGATLASNVTASSLTSFGASIVLGTPASGTLTNATGLPISTGVSGLGAGIAAFLATPSSANLITAVTNETGNGNLVFSISPVFTTPTIDAATGISIALTGSAKWNTFQINIPTVSTPVTGGTVAAATTQWNIINPAGTLATLTVTLPGSPVDGQEVVYSFTKTITTLTFAGGTLNTAITTAAADSQVHLGFSTSLGSKWVRR